MKSKYIVALFIALVLVSCQALSAQVPTNTVVPTDTPSPSATFTPRPTRTKQPTATVTPTDTPVPTRTFAPIPPERPDGDQISGTYILEREDGGYCAARVVLQPFVPVYEEVVVEFFCLRGPPSYNSGYAPPQKLLLSNNLAVYSVDESDFYDYSDIYTDFSEAPCHIVFQFGKDKITATQLGMSSCGFGHAVFADGVYKLVDPKPPVLGCLSIWDACSALYPLPE